MKKIILFVSFLWALNLISQTITGTPPHAYNLSSTTTNSNFFSQAAPYKKFQFIYTNSELGNFATPITASVPITQLWFKHSGTTVPPATALSNFKILIGHSNTAPNTLDTNFNLNYSTAPLTCLNEPSFTYTVSGQWVGINLTTPFPYDGISNICIQLEYSASSNIMAGNIISTSNQSLFANSVTAVKGALALNRPYIGFAAGPPCSVPSFALPNDSLVCGTNTITLNVPTNVNNTTLYTYQWIRKLLPTSPTGVNVGTGLTLTTVNTTATYVLVVSNIPFTCSKRDSITVTYSAAAPNFSLGTDITFCAVNNSTQIKPVPALITPTAGLTFQWTGTTLPPSAPGPITGIPTPTAQTTTPTLAGQYVLTVSRGLCKTRDTIKITTPVPTFALPNDTTVCNGIPLVINAPAVIATSPVPPGFTVAWFSHPFASFTPLAIVPGTSFITAPLVNTDHYYVFVVSGPSSCVKKDSIRVRYNSSSLAFTLINDTFFCKTPNVIQLKPKVAIPTAGLTFSWTALDLVANTPVALIPAPTNNQIYIPSTNAGRYILRVTDVNGCVTRDTVRLFDRSVPIFDLMPFTLSKDTAVCTSSAAFAINVPLIVSTTPPYTYTWITHPFTSYTPNVVTTGMSSILTNPAVFQRVYTLRVFNGFCFRTDSMRVTYDSVPLYSLGPDLTYCGTALNNTNPAAPIGVQLKPIPLISPIGTLTFQWTGTTIPPANPGPITGIPTPAAQTTTPPNPGQYILTVTKGLCKRRDTILLRPAIPTNIKLISKDTALCLGQTSLAIPIPTSVSASPPYTYSWYQYNVGAYAAGTTLPSGTTTVTAISPAPPPPLGQYYTLTVSNGTCSRRDSIKVRFGGNSALFSLIADTFYCTAVNNVVLKPLSPIIPPLTNPATVYNFQWSGTTISPAVPGVNITGAGLGTTPTLQTTTPPGPGQYVLTSLNVNSGCKYSDTVVLRNRRIGDAQYTDRDTSICDAAITSITLTAPPVPGTNLGNPYTYNWIQHPFLSLVPSTSVSALITVVATNAFTNHWYVVNISNGFCIDKDSVRVRFGLPTAINLIKDTFYCSAPNNNVLIGPSIPLPVGVGTGFQWAGITILPDIPNIPIVGGALGTATVQNTTPTGAGQYTLTYTNSAGCKSKDTIVLKNRRVNKFDFNPKSISLCNGEASYTINVPAIPTPIYGNAYTYTWSTYPFTGVSPGVVVSNGTSVVCPNTLLDNFYYLEVFNGFCKNSDSVRVRFGFPTPFTLGRDTFFCDNMNTTVQAYPIYPTPAPLGITYQWTSFGPTVGFSPPSSATLIAITPIVTSNYVLTNTNAAGCIFKDTVLISKKYLAPISLGIDKLICNDRYSNVPILKPTTVVTPQTWNWQYLNPNPSPVGTPNSGSLTATLPGNYILNYTNGSCTVRDTINVTYADSTIFSLGPNTYFCTSINQDTLSPIVPLPVAPWINKPWTYLWTGTAIGSSTAITLTAGTNFSNTQNLLPTIAGNYLLTVTNDSGCKSRDVIRLNNYKVVITAPLLITSNPANNPRDTVLCNVSNYPLKGPALPAAVAPFTWTYKWYKKPNVNSTNLLNSTQNYTASAGAAGSGEYILFINNGFCNDTDKINIVFSSNPVVNLGSDDTLCSPFIKALNGPNSPNPLTTTYLYTWTNVGSPTVLANTQSYNTANPGSYVLQVNNQFGCKKNDTLVVNARTIAPFALGNDSGVCTPASITIAGPPSLAAPNNYNYSWNTSPPTFVTPPTTSNLITFNSGTYVLTIKNGPCVRKDSIKMEFLNQPIVELPKDCTSICGKNLYNIVVQPITIDNSLTYTWSDGTIGPINNIKFDGTYTITASNKYCSSTDNIVITSRLKPVLSSLGPDREYCSSDTFSLLLDPITNFNSATPFTVSWQPGGQATKSILVKAPGTYIVKVSNGLKCEALDTLVIKSFLSPNLIIPDSLFICGTGNFTVNVSCNAQNYLWNTGSKDSILVIKDDGYYNVTASNGNGKCKVTKNLFVDQLERFTIGSDFDFCPENENPTVEISDKVNPYQWFKLGDNKFVDADGKRKLVIKKPGIYYAAVTKGKCTLYDTVTVKAFKNYNLFIPNSFSPSDGGPINPKFYVKATDIKDFNIKVFTRFGEVIFQSSDANFTWDGKNPEGKKVMSGAYVYSVSYKSFCTGDEVFSEKGILNVF